MANAPYYILQSTGSTKPGRDLTENIRKISQDFNAIDSDRQAMLEQRDRPAGTLTVRGSNTAGQVTLESGHAIVTGQLFDLTWSGGQRTGVTAGTVDTLNVPFSGGSGDNLPSQDAAVTTFHFKTVAKVYGFHTGDGSTLDPSMAHRGYYEVASAWGTCQAALAQLVARYKQ